MKIITEVNDFFDARPLLSGQALDNFDMLDLKEIDIILGILPDMTDTEFNDFFWFETGFIAKSLGYEDWEELCYDR